MTTQLCLRHAEGSSPKWMPHRVSQHPRQFVRLIESSPEMPPRVQRHGHDSVRIGEEPRPRLCHERAKRWAQRPVAAILQGMDDLTQGAFVEAESSGEIEVRRMGNATCAATAAAGTVAP